MSRNARARKRPAEAARGLPLGGHAPLEVRTLLALSVIAFAVRAWAARAVGFGDSEALYASWAVHPQPAYLDHPGLIGLLARAIGEGAAPTPARAHLVTAALATATPWVFFAAARTFGADRRRSALGAILFLFVPEIGVGLFALTPDLLLAPLWLGALALANVGLTAPRGSSRSATAFVIAGLLAGVACAAKASGALLFAALVVTYARTAWRASRDEADQGSSLARGSWPWVGLAIGAVVFAPVVVYEAKLGFPMLRHRFVETGLVGGSRGSRALSVATVVLGQAVYVSPVVVLLLYRGARRLFVDRRQRASDLLLFTAFALPLLPLLVFAAWSHHAEPHWIAPALLAPGLAATRGGLDVGRSLYTAALSVAAALTAAAHLWVLTPLSAALMPESADARFDIANELYGWPAALEAVRDQMSAAATPFDREGREVVVVGPHWTVCAQLHAGLPGVRVGCATPIPDDFDRWTPRAEWRQSDHVLFVTDNRFEGDGAEQLPAHVRAAESRVRVLRGGRTARVFQLYLYERRAGAHRGSRPDDHVAARRPDLPPRR